MRGGGWSAGGLVAVIGAILAGCAGPAPAPPPVPSPAEPAPLGGPARQHSPPAPPAAPAPAAPGAPPSAPQAASAPWPQPAAERTDSPARHAAAEPDAIYGEPGARLRALIAGLPRRPPGGGLAGPAEYALPPERIGELGELIEACLRRKPQGTRSPSWLLRAQLVLESTRAVAAEGELAEAERLLQAGEPLGALRALARGRAYDAQLVLRPEAQRLEDAAREQIGQRLLVLAERAAAEGLLELAGLRARQATELWPRLEQPARELLQRLAAQRQTPRVVVLPFQDYTGLPEAVAGWEQLLLAALAVHGVEQVLGLEEYRRLLREPRPAPRLRLLQGELVRLEQRRAAGPAAAWTLAAERLRALEAERAAERARAPEAVAARLVLAAEEATAAELARVERRRSEMGLEPARTELALQPLVLWLLEVRWSLHDPGAGRHERSGAWVRAEAVAAAQAASGRAQLLQAAADAVAAAVAGGTGQRSERPHPDRIRDPRARLDAQIGFLEAEGGAARDPSMAQAVLEATGYSYAEGRTLLDRLTLE
ncbi:MAG: hypothetical protein KatS3mg102_1172 [Planctomycetota bacterium]|nr:MAG: hypothetical protein KatS3mg102_1172 [Planctomycetota bacterium]